ncbi:MAG: SMP-30/gluconolactonase/LRE family protein [Planctomycetaceae bacterium]|nr:SMP-30/gluconolactonase/LRE family protein [Planctomycetales bacterium]MCB9927501.1 SMP-30/gluconolactonase/LRE family protein [Planctomycetaceae bacterium]
MSNTTRICLTLILFAIAGRASNLRGEESELPPNHSVEPELYATGFEFAEGPAFDRDGNLFVVNYRGNGNIGRITADGTASVWCVLDEIAPIEGKRSQANGLKVDSEGRLIVADAGGGRLLRVASDGKSAQVLADRWNGARFKSINDVALDLMGNIYFSDPGGSNAETPIGSVYRFDITTNTVTQLATQLAFPNGLAVTIDQRHLCVAESSRYRVLIYDLNGGNAENERVLIEFPQESAGDIRGGAFDPDGMILDEAGRLYVAMWIGGVINVVDVASGELLRQYDAGGLKATNCHFYDGYLYTTVAAKEAVFRLKLGVKGFNYN